MTSTKRNFTPSPYQIAVADVFNNEKRHMRIDAVAGSGKTTTVEWLLTSHYKGELALYTVFNKRNEVEANERMGELDHVMTATLNALGYRAMNAGLGKGRYKVEAMKVWDIIRDHLSKPENKTYGKTVKHLVDLARSEAIGMPGIDIDDDSEWTRVIEKYDVETETGEMDTYTCIDLARKVLKISIAQAVKSRLIDFNDQNYIPAIGAVRVVWPAVDTVFVDEAQDLNEAQVACISQIVAQRNARLIIVGDPWQAIYGFRGAVNGAMDVIAQRFQMKTMPLSVCWRCDAAMIRLAQTTGAPIEIAPGKPEGILETVETYMTRPADVVLCRVSAPLVQGAYALIAQGKPATVLGKDIGTGLISLIEKLRAKNVNELESKLSKWLEAEIEAAEESNKPHKAAAAEDKAECLRVLIGQLSGAERTVKTLISIIESLFSDEASKDAVVFSTIHKAKGREWDRVIILDRERMPIRWARLDWQKQQEIHCMYVAFTRARHEMFFVSSEGLNKGPGKLSASFGDNQLM